MNRYRKKPIVVEAFQMTIERRCDNSEWPIWLHKAWQKPIEESGSLFCSNDGCLKGETNTPLFIYTPEGVHRVSWDDWIIQGIQGELYPCKPDIFDATYETITESKDHAIDSNHTAVDVHAGHPSPRPRLGTGW